MIGIKDPKEDGNLTLAAQPGPPILINTGPCVSTNLFPGGIGLDTLGHTRNPSSLSQQSKGYGSLPSHSRQGSTDSAGHIRYRFRLNLIVYIFNEDLNLIIFIISRNPSSGSGFSDILKYNSAERKQRIQKKLLTGTEEAESRVDSTRVNAEQLIDELLSKETADASNQQLVQDNEVGLELFVSKDGTATLGSRDVKSKVKRSKPSSAGPSRAGSRPGSVTGSRQSLTEKESASVHL